MIKRSELAKGQYVRVTSEANDTFWERFALGRYFQVDTIDASPDDAGSCGPCHGDLIFWGINYCHQIFNGDMEPISEAEQTAIEAAFQNRGEFKELFRLGRKFERLEEKLDDLCTEFGHINVWEHNTLESLLEDVSCCIDDPEEYDLEDLQEEISELWNEIIKVLDKLDEAEQRLITHPHTNPI